MGNEEMSFLPPPLFILILSCLFSLSGSFISPPPLHPLEFLFFSSPVSALARPTFLLHLPPLVNYQNLAKSVGKRMEEEVEVVWKRPSFPLHLLHSHTRLRTDQHFPPRLFGGFSKLPPLLSSSSCHCREISPDAINRASSPFPATPYAPPLPNITAATEREAKSPSPSHFLRRYRGEERERTEEN